MIEPGLRFYNPATGVADTYEVITVTEDRVTIHNITKDEPAGVMLISALETFISEGHYRAFTIN